MSTASSILIRPKLLQQIHDLAADNNRPEEEVVEEALRSYIEADRHFTEILRNRIAQADAGDCATEAESEAFFARHAR